MPTLTRFTLALFLFSLFTNSHATDAATAKEAGKIKPGTDATAAKPLVPRFDHVVIVIMENEDQEQIIGNANAPYINHLAQAGANFTDAHALTHPSQPNYLALFSGSTQDVTDNSCPLTFRKKANLASQLVAAKLTFSGFSEDLPTAGYTGCKAGKYRRKHNPWVNFDNVDASSNQPFTAFPGTDFAALPTVSIVVPNLCNDHHDCPIQTGDAWLKARFDDYVQWARTHNSLFILTWDEDASRKDNHIPTVMAGATVKPGNYRTTINHYHVLRTLQAMFGLAPIENTAAVAPITNIWTTK
ncbi:alkaline phosphatase family protein [Candidatus Accumulibacter vicinus]|nr:alkaline phosphatase family protein [Candidatus Accumulibacter vicinus]